MPFIGFPNKTLIGPVWVKMQTDDPAALKHEFDRLLTLSFNRLIAAHGTLLNHGANAAIRQAIQDCFG